TSETEEDDISKRLRDTVAAVASAEIPVPKPAVFVEVENQEEEEVDDTGCNPLYHLPTPQPHNSQNPRTTVIYCCTNGQKIQITLDRKELVTAAEMRSPDADPLPMPPHLNEWDEKHYFWYPVKFSIGAGHYGTCNPDLVDCWDRSLHDTINMKDWFADLETGNVSNKILTRKQMELELFATYGDHHNTGKQNNIINCWKSKLSTTQLQAWELYRHMVHNQELEFYRWEFFRSSTHYVAATTAQRIDKQKFVIQRIEEQMAKRDQFIYTIVS
ncbi:MAG: hypothetical protein GY740_22160, partial [Gammaproteobacteria bacterium]|nr:hypothetical protein [Gammaproteobacteria bacterium]